MQVHLHTEYVEKNNTYPKIEMLSLTLTFQTWLAGNNILKQNSRNLVSSSAGGSRAIRSNDESSRVISCSGI